MDILDNCRLCADCGYYGTLSIIEPVNRIIIDHRYFIVACILAFLLIAGCAKADAGIIFRRRPTGNYAIARTGNDVRTMVVVGFFNRIEQAKGRDISQSQDDTKIGNSKRKRLFGRRK